jgi:uncharacterized membrane protein (UPF0127 family)
MLNKILIGLFRISILLWVITAILTLLYIIKLTIFKQNKNWLVCIKNFCRKVKIASTPQQRRKWLMFVKHLKENEWMLFIFEKSWIYWFWMKNTYIPLDIIWIDKNFRITKIWQKAQPCLTWKCKIVYNKKPAQYVLEIPWWESEKLKISTWEEVKIIFQK